MRLIDADALILELQKSGEENPSRKPIADGFISILRENCPTIEFPRDWTPCAEGLPTESGRYIVTVKRTVLGKETEFTSERDFYVYLSSGHRWESTGIVDENIIAWMPKFKPDPYCADNATGKVKEDADNGN